MSGTTAGAYGRHPAMGMVSGRSRAACIWSALEEGVVAAR